MKRTLNLKSKIIMFLLTIIFPLSATGIVFSVNHVLSAKADDSSTTYLDSYFEEVSMSNNNFNSNPSQTHSMTTVSSWTALNGQGTTTTGIINVGQPFQTHMASTYYLSNNPGRKAQANDDYKILMINSKSNNSSDHYQASKGYRSDSVSLEANSFYQFSVAFKTDTNYKTNTEYVTADGHVITETDNCYISKGSFEDAKWGDYVSFTYTSSNNNTSTQYAIKSLEDVASYTLSADLTNIQLFYEEEKADGYVGFMYESATDVFTPVYTLKTNIQPMNSEDTSAGYKILNGAELFKCKTFAYNQTDNRYDILKDTTYYTEKETYDPIDDYVYGSIYLNGLKDKDGKTIKADFEKVNSKEWETFYFYIATGNESQSVNLDLWLGANSQDRTSTGVVFFDDCHVYRYSANKFWSLYKDNLGLSYTQEITYTDNEGNVTNTEEFKQSCEQLIDLRQEEKLAFNGKNFNFEKSDSDINNWEVITNNGHAKVFNTNAPENFAEGYQNVGSDFSCNVDFSYDTNGNISGLTLNPNQYVLALWAKDGVASVKSEMVNISANDIYKVTASYKVSEIKSGNAYMQIKENDKVLTDYDLTLYTLTDKESSALSSNGTDNFNNKYNTVEFYVKAGALYDTNFNIVLGLGKDTEKATGCIAFDNIKIERSTTEAYDSATNKVEFNAKEADTTVPNGNFNKQKVTAEDKIYAPQNWTVEGDSNKLNFYGVIKTQTNKYQEYVTKYEEYRNNGVKDEENPYVWTINAGSSPTNSDTPNNALMLANYGKTTQTLKSENLTIGTSNPYHLTFKYKTTSSIIVKLYKEDGLLLLKSPELNSMDWTDYDIYLNPGETEYSFYIEIEFKTETNSNSFTYAYFDDFDYQSYSGTLDLEAEEKVNQYSATVDLSNGFLNLPTNNITDNLQDSSNVAFEGKAGTSSSGLFEGGLLKADSSNYPEFSSNQDSPLYIKDKNVKYVMYMSVQDPGSYTMTSNYKVSIDADAYAKLTFKLRTNFTYQKDSTNPLNSEESYNYGVTAGLTGFDYATQLKTEDKNGYQEYTIYFHNTSSETINESLYFALICDQVETTGVAVIYDFDFQKLDSDSEYTSAQETSSQENYNINAANEKVFISKLTNQEEENDTTTNEENNTENNNASADSNWWILAPSLITGLAIIIAVVGYVLRKIKIKKIERKKKETYDRKESLHIDVIKKKALEERNAELKSVEETRDKFQNELNTMEKEHKEKVVSLRSQDKNKVSKDTDKEFKQFARKRTVISERIDALNKQIEEIKSPDYLLNVERRVYAKEEMKQKELAKMSKKLNKEQEKLSKEQTKQDSDKK